MENITQKAETFAAWLKSEGWRATDYHVYDGNVGASFTIKVGKNLTQENVLDTLDPWSKELGWKFNDSDFDGDEQVLYVEYSQH
tara:strand:+ start:197 stop:448 length:252 start_codon:yes stop_codon:yes gene_type:complete